MARKDSLSVALIPSHLLAYVESSSDSSESDDDFNRTCEQKFAQLFDMPNSIPKATGYVKNVVRMYSEKDFRRNFRLPRKSCYALIERFSQCSFFPSSQRHSGSPGKTAEEHMLSFLWYAANKASMREVSVLFDTAESTQLVIINRVLDFMCSIAPGEIYFSSNKEAVAREFEKERQQEIAQHRILREEECKEASQSIPTQRESALRRLGELKRSNLAQRL
ncbi:uncharacterized protein LOC125942809 [Dermacentor silvarum]|uniref:uncharacterized protein LOC125942809 n=1 Tax=Dermacentor silvarum TaxID=543639 RepID=UPI002101A930|nr:uncharacterized protein LOC125942809 [Dermacentor silvarum]